MFDMFSTRIYVLFFWIFWDPKSQRKMFVFCCGFRILERFLWLLVLKDVQLTVNFSEAIALPLSCWSQNVFRISSVLGVSAFICACKLLICFFKAIWGCYCNKWSRRCNHYKPVSKLAYGQKICFDRNVKVVVLILWFPAFLWTLKCLMFT
jgi:hypothetical protein